MKILFITRDPRAVATSAFHFFSKIDLYEPLIKLYDIKNVNDFAKIIFEGKFVHGSIKEYNETWMNFIGKILNHI